MGQRMPSTEEAIAADCSAAKVSQAPSTRYHKFEVVGRLIHTLPDVRRF